MRQVALLTALLSVGAATAQQLSVKWEELTAAEFMEGLKRSQSVCVLPVGILEKHGPHLPIGTDLINVRYIALHGAAEEYAIVFPEYYFGQIFEAKHEPGTIAYSAKLQFDLLQETSDEMARNGCKKIVIINGHGGNTYLLPYFSQMQLATPRDYQVYVYMSAPYPPGRPKLRPGPDGHAGESETSHTLISRPDLVHMELAKTESGAQLNRISLAPGLFTWFSWYSRFPDHYSGDGSLASKELGEFDMKALVANFARALKSVKDDRISLPLLKEFYEKMSHPLDTRQQYLK